MSGITVVPPRSPPSSTSATASSGFASLMAAANVSSGAGVGSTTSAAPSATSSTIVASRSGPQRWGGDIPLSLGHCTVESSRSVLYHSATSIPLYSNSFHPITSPSLSTPSLRSQTLQNSSPGYRPLLILRSFLRFKYHQFTRGLFFVGSTLEYLPCAQGP
ncbi:hypothetical protein C8R45DRAFT_426104 [Mycena sanguinolenta]|nr:hypothetical protein C8R45DRAFT_426104 [Mycena sanguinolenta]